MTVEDWLAVPGNTRSRFVLLTGVQSSELCRYLKGVRRFPLKACIDIDRGTKGAVGLDDIVIDPHEKLQLKYLKEKYAKGH